MIKETSQVLHVSVIRPYGICLKVGVGWQQNRYQLPHSYILVTDFVKMHPADLQPKSMADVLKEMLHSKLRLGMSPEYVRQLEHQCGKFSDMCIKNIGDVTAEDLRLFVGTLEKLKPKTRNNCIGGVKELFKFAKRQRYVPKDFDQLDGLEYFAEDEGEVAILKPEQLAGLLANADARIIPAIVIGAFGGLRGSEMQKLQWSEVDQKRGFITVLKQKVRTKGRRLVPILNNLAAWLAPLTGSVGPVVPMTIDQYRALRVEAARAAGFEWPQNALRHSFCSYRLADVQDAAKVALEAGNSPQMLFQHYRELVTPDEAKAWFGIVPNATANVVPMKAVGDK